MTIYRRRVYDIVSLLPLEDLDVLRRDWTMGVTPGVTKEHFLTTMLRVSGSSTAMQDISWEGGRLYRKHVT